MGRIFSGVQPTGNLHLGNYLGAIRRWVRLQQEYECLYCVVDLHAITLPHKPEQLRDNTREVTAALLAAGIDPERHIVFNQSRVPAHSQLAWILNCVARVGWLNRMTQFKEKAGKQKENASVGLYTYPVLMAADILLYRATHVPVGDDQKQHVELARDIAQRFNSDFAPDFFPVPHPVITGPATRVMSLRDATKKMSKSDDTDYSRINITDDADLIRAKVRKAKTDPDPLPGPEQVLDSGDLAPKLIDSRPEVVNLLSIFAGLTDRPMTSVLEEFGGQSFASFKQTLTDVIVAEIAPIATEMRRLLADDRIVDEVLAKGAERARALAEPTLHKIEMAVGFLSGRAAVL